MMSSDPRDTREKILRAAWSLLERADADGARMADIAREAGVSRQAVYLHFPKRADLLIATVRYIDEVKDVGGRLSASRAAATGVERLDALIDAWVGYIPEIHGCAKALMAMRDTDDDARRAWDDRMTALRDEIGAAVAEIEKEGKLSPERTAERATDLLWAVLSVPMWEQLTIERGWTRADHAEEMRALASRIVRETG
jgi:AcrR family transcriptional regulator